MSAFMVHMDRIQAELHTSSGRVHDLATGLRGLVRLAAHALEQNGTQKELALLEVEVLAGLLAERATATATDLEPLIFGERLQAKPEELRQAEGGNDAE